MSDISPDLLKIFACPKCKSPVTQIGAELHCSNSIACGLRYPIRNGIPILLIDQALPRNSHVAS